VDGLDNVATRQELAALCRELGIPLVHGAIAGWYGQVSVQLPGDDMSPLLRHASAQGTGVEKTLGNPFLHAGGDREPPGGGDHEGAPRAREAAVPARSLR
jgi:molybdopterin/thiamine biosynthesis adenylyltransferase